MTDTFNQLKDELSVLYPDVTDAELNEMTERLIFLLLVRRLFMKLNTKQKNPD